MAARPKKSPFAPEVQSILDDAVAKLQVAVYGEKGYPELGTRFTAIEDQSCDLGDALTRALVQAVTAQQAAETPAERCACGTPLEEPDVAPHPLTTRRGDVGWNEPTGYCPKCRQAFFPSVPRVGD